MRIILIIVFIGVYLTFGLELGYTGFSPFWKILTYSFQHASLFHLIVNSVALYSIFGVIEKRFKPHYVFIVSYLIAIVGALFHIAVQGDVVMLPTVGSSGMIFAAFGIMYSYVRRGYLYKGNKEGKRAFFIAVVLSLIFGFFFKNVAGFLHIGCFALGIIVAEIFKIGNYEKKDRYIKYPNGRYNA